MFSVIKVSIFFLFGITLSSCLQERTEANISEEINSTKLEMVTTHGTMTLELYNETPLHRDNFINLASNKAYDSLLFHRVIGEFMIQSGDPDSRDANPGDALGEGDAPYLVDAEFNENLFHKKGVLAAARDNHPTKASSAMQFYIVQGKVFTDSTLGLAEIRLSKNKAFDYFKKIEKQTTLIDSIDSAMDQRNFPQYKKLRDSLYQIALKDESFESYIIPESQRSVYKSIGGTPHLDQNYTIFGEVIKGISVIDSIATVETDSSNRPIEDIRILRLRVLNN